MGDSSRHMNIEACCFIAMSV